MPAHRFPHPTLGRRTIDEVAAMTLESFARAGLVVEVRSTLFDEVVLFASDNARLSPQEPRAVYRAADLARWIRRCKSPQKGSLDRDATRVA
jgi:hypothetical protein